MKNIKIEFDKKANAVYIQLYDKKVFIKSVVTFDDNVNVDYQVSTDEIVGIEILGVESVEINRDK